MRKKLPEDSQRKFVEEVREIEERLFPSQLHPKKPSFMKSEGRAWLYRPSHHIASGLLTEEDIEKLKKSEKKLLSVGAHPGFLEQVLVALGVPRENILLADSDPALVENTHSIPTKIFDMHEPWNIQDSFDIIIFPESLCISMSDKMPAAPEAEPFTNDAEDIQLLTKVMSQALAHLKSGGVIRANGPMSHPKIVEAMRKNLEEEGHKITVEYQRFLLTIRSVTQPFS